VVSRASAARFLRARCVCGVALSCGALIAACGDDELQRPKVNQPAEGATTGPEEVAPGETPATTLRKFRALYDAKNPDACKLVTDGLVPSPSEDLACEGAVTRQAFALTLVTLRQTGNQVKGNNASIRALLRDPGGERINGRIELRRGSDGWRISRLTRALAGMHEQTGTYRATGATHLGQLRSWLSVEGRDIDTIWSDGYTAELLPLAARTTLGRPVWSGKSRIFAPDAPPEPSTREGRPSAVVLYGARGDSRQSQPCGACKLLAEQTLGRPAALPTTWRLAARTPDGVLAIYVSR